MEKLQAVDWRGLYKSATNTVKKYAKNMSELEIQVEDATNAEVWGPHGSVMNDIAEASYDPESYRQIMSVIGRRLKEEGENWRMCYKALLLLEFLIKHGPARIAQDVQSSQGVLERLTRFQFKDPNGRDHGQNVRHRAAEIRTLIGDPEALRVEREKARANRQKYTGVSADDMRSGVRSFGGGGYGNSNAARPSAGLSSERPNIVAGASSWVPTLEPAGGRHSTLAGTSFNREPESTAMSFSSQPSLRGSDAGDLADSSHVIMRRGGRAEPAPLRSVSEDEALAATRARIEALRVSGDQAARMPSEETGGQRKRLTDVKVNPKIAASLGLKIVQAPPKAAAPAPAAAQVHATAAPAPAAAPPAPADLIGNLLEDPEPVRAAPEPVSAGQVDFFSQVAAPEPAAPTPAAAPPTAPAAADGWDAFGAPAPESSASGRGALPEDMFSALSSPKTTSPVNQSSANTFEAMLGAGGYGTGAAHSRAPLQNGAAPIAPKPDPFADLFK